MIEQCSSRVQMTFRRAGWYVGRSVDLSRLEYWFSLDKVPRLTFADGILRETYGLVVDFAPGGPYSKASFDAIDVLSHMPGYDIKLLSEHVGVDLCPIGEFPENILFVGRNQEFYVLNGLFADVHQIASVHEALEWLCDRSYDAQKATHRLPRHLIELFDLEEYPRET